MSLSFNLTLINILKIIADIITIFMLIGSFMETIKKCSFKGNILIIIIFLLNIFAINFNWK